MNAIDLSDEAQPHEVTERLLTLIIRSATLGDACQSKNLQISVSVRTYT